MEKTQVTWSLKKKKKQFSHLGTVVQHVERLAEHCPTVRQPGGDGVQEAPLSQLTLHTPCHIPGRS